MGINGDAAEARWQVSSAHSTDFSHTTIVFGGLFILKMNPFSLYKKSWEIKGTVFGIDIINFLLSL